MKQWQEQQKKALGKKLLSCEIKRLNVTQLPSGLKLLTFGFGPALTNTF